MEKSNDGTIKLQSKRKENIPRIIRIKQKLSQHNVYKATLVHINGMSQEMTESGGLGRKGCGSQTADVCLSLVTFM